MRTHYRPLAVEQAEDRCLPSALTPAAEHHAAVDQPPEPDDRARAGQADWFTGDADALDR